ncbi:16S rRNA (uracil(1498)-N(3))-methyltransferase [Desulfolucanica intricata]|uniref:16S rRNA (uracil(1498)-N(3))-methyltransferase n=1 Tax=Desulfolucanica intricata TaxID=1285191 RepID=UPI0008348843|nr:16S rRNA (uracil(1498)-N(3))-methyltransferase [Desulfolucanica intricata]
MARVFVASTQIKGGQAFICGEEMHHINRVLRLGEGDELTVLDGLGGVFEARITGKNKDTVFCEIIDQGGPDNEPPLKVTLVQGLPKADKMDLIVQKGTELGLSRVIPLKCERSVVRLDEKKAAQRQERWQRIALEAAKQSRRAKYPVIESVSNWEEVLTALPEDALALIPWEEEYNTGIKSLGNNGTLFGEIYVFIGPEGGFTETEVSRAQEFGVIPVSLGPRILRTETAGLAVLTMLMYEYGDLGGT